MVSGFLLRLNRYYFCWLISPQWKRREPDKSVMIDRLLLEKTSLAGIARVLPLSQSGLQHCDRHLV
ncbi:hypothetical protein H6F88_16615 [Oculatella sp. FACHB-28]|nr:hypothetical protein [Oculatella sp. FACHB-28]